MKSSFDDIFLIFDMDGVILDSLSKLSNCLIESISSFCSSEIVYEKFKSYDLANPGLSRFEKIDFFLDLQKDLGDYNRKAISESILSKFDELSMNARIASKIDEDIFSFANLNVSNNLVLVSNCDKNQLRSISAHFGLHKVFKNQLFGTPPNKSEIVKSLVSRSNAMKIYSISDSESDAIIARNYGIDFVFIEKFARTPADWIKPSEIYLQDLKTLRMKFN